jgi:hypothetical protein
MPQENWLAAIEVCNAKQRAQQSPVVQPVVPSISPEIERIMSSATSISVALEDFAYSEEGVTARKLLQVSKRHIVLAEENEGGGFGVVYFMDGNGLGKSIEAMGMWQAYSKAEDIPKPKIKNGDRYEIARLIARLSNGTATPEAVLGKIRNDLDTIAAQISK